WPRGTWRFFPGAAASKRHSRPATSPRDTSGQRFAAAAQSRLQGRTPSDDVSYCTSDEPAPCGEEPDAASARPVEVAMARAVPLVAHGDAAGAARLVEAALSAA